ncbi:MAG: holo-ACP synthase, partial [Planctomycetota bacterium]
AKEAAMKCLGTGWSAGVGFRDVEVTRNDDGAVGLRLVGAAAARAAALGIERWHVSLTHTDDVATAFVVAEGGA